MADEVRDLTVDVECVHEEGEHVHHVPNVKEVGQSAVSDLDQFQDQERDESLTQDDQTDDLSDELRSELVVLVVREVARVEDERDEVEHEGQEELIEDCSEVALPHEVDEDADLRACKDRVVLGLGQSGNQASRVVSNEDPVEIKDLCFNLLQVRVVGNMGLRLHFTAILTGSIE